MVILDTNIIIDHLRLPSTKPSVLIKLVQQQPKINLAISIISVQELYEGKSTQKPDKEQILLSLISPLKILPYTFDIASLAGQIIRDTSQPITFADAAIAATSIYHQIPLFTLNQKHFQPIPDLKLFQLNQ